MILSGQTIRKRGIFTPFHERTKFMGMTFGVGPAGYDVRLSERILFPLGAFALASTIEHLEMPRNPVGIVHDKRTSTRKSLV